ncbi:hypothetical protein PSP31121_05670 [Pandoraea sputorum]|uniref:Uncharacterized protein n=1 Tax=Pandoraea sputorum TaxID=93222 RepID=A0A5E5BIH2_9BURK|nr:hypothetical protein PSP31121_05670 [Pandoraea sputorum]
MLPVLGREVVEGEQIVAVLLEYLSGLRIFGLVARNELVEGRDGLGTRGRIPDLAKPRFGFAMLRLRQGIVSTPTEI